MHPLESGTDITCDRLRPVSVSMVTLPSPDVQMQYTYCEEVNSNLICCICRSPFVDPQTSETCSHTFCKGCISQALAQTPQCPIDRSRLTIHDLRPSPGIIRNLVDELLVHCRHPQCDAVIQRGLADYHENAQCEYSLLRCSAEGCDSEVFRRDMKGHVEELCCARTEKCADCGGAVRSKKRMSHIASCAASQDTCAACNELVPRQMLREHLESCPSTMVNCPSSTHGCSIVVKRCDLPAHMSHCPFQALSSFFALNDARLAVMTRDQNRLATQVERLEAELQSARREAEEARRSLGRFYGRQGEGSAEDPTAQHSHNNQPSHSEPIAPNSIPWPQDQAIPDPTSDPGFFSTAPEVDLSFPPQTAFAMAPARLGPLSAWSTMSISEAVTALRNVVQGLAHAMDGLERRFELRTTTESLRVLEEVGSLRAIVHGLRMQVMKDRTHLLQRAYYPSDSIVSIPFLQSQAQSSSSRLSQDIHVPFENSRRDRDFESAERFSRTEIDDMDGYTATRYVPPTSAFSAWRSSRRDSQTGPKL